MQRSCKYCHSDKIVKVNMKSTVYYNPHIPMGMVKNVKVIKTICCNCGHIDEWIKNMKDLEKIYQKYTKE